MRRLLIAALIIMLLPAPAFPQANNNGPPTARTELEKKNDAAIDKAYQETIKRMKDDGQSAKSDPWQSVRPANAESTSTKR